MRKAATTSTTTTSTSRTTSRSSSMPSVTRVYSGRQQRQEPSVGELEIDMARASIGPTGTDADAPMRSDELPTSVAKSRSGRVAARRRMPTEDELSVHEEDDGEEEQPGSRSMVKGHRSARAVAAESDDMEQVRRMHITLCSPSNSLHWQDSEEDKGSAGSIAGEVTADGGANEGEDVDKVRQKGKARAVEVEDEDEDSGPQVVPARKLKKQKEGARVVSPPQVSLI